MSHESAKKSGSRLPMVLGVITLIGAAIALAWIVLEALGKEGSHSDEFDGV